MLEERVQVVDSDDEHIWVEVRSRSACSQCSSSNCATSVISKLFTARRNQLKLHNSIGASKGDWVLIAVSDRQLVKASLLAYLVPLLAMLASVIVADLLGTNEILQALAALAGLAAGSAFVYRFAGSGQLRKRFSPILSGFWTASGESARQQINLS